MIDPIGTRPGTTSSVRSDTVKAVGVAARSTPVPASTEQNVPAAITAQATVRQMAARPPVDQERVEIIRAAIADGRFPITPATIADRLIAFHEGWRPE